MTDTRVVNYRREECDVVVDRSSPFGNPFRIGRDGTRAQVVDKFREYFLDRISRDNSFREQVQELRGKVLGCSCRPEICHGDVIAAWLRGEL